MALLDAATYKVNHGSAAADATVTAAIASAEGWIAARLGVASLDSTAYTDEPHTGTGGRSLSLRSIGIDTGEAFTIKLLGSGGTSTTIDSDRYRISGDDARRGIVRLLDSEAGAVADDSPFTPHVRHYDRGAEWPTAPVTLLVTMTGGYTTGTVPASLRAAIEICTTWMMGVTNPAVNSSVGGVSHTRRTATEYIADIDAMLAPWYRRLGVSC